MVRSVMERISEHVLVSTLLVSKVVIALHSPDSHRPWSDEVQLSTPLACPHLFAPYQFMSHR